MLPLIIFSIFLLGSASVISDRTLLDSDSNSKQLITTTRDAYCAVHSVNVEEGKHYLLFSTLISESQLMTAKIELLQGPNVISHCTTEEWENANAMIVYEID